LITLFGGAVTRRRREGGAIAANFQQQKTNRPLSVASVSLLISRRSKSCFALSRISSR
jgi:hypothetical protein